jgi:uncharacterized membrane protein YebE (DUF533 family)
MKEGTDAASHPKLYEIRLLICVAQADGYLDEEEKERIFHQVNLDIFTVRERQMLHDDLEHPKNPEELAQEVCPYLTMPEKMMLIRKMFKLASLDKEMTQEEIVVIYLIGETLGLTRDKIAEIQEWVVEGIAWLLRWENIVAAGKKASF